MRGPARKAKQDKVDYKKLADLGKGVSFFATPAYQEGKKPAAAAPAAAKPKRAAPGKAKKARSRGGPTYTDVVRRAIAATAKPFGKGASVVAIKTYLATHVPTKTDPVHIRLALRRGVANGTILRVAASYRLPAKGGAAAAAKSPKKKKAVAAAPPAADGAAAAAGGGAAAAASPAKRAAAPEKAAPVKKAASVSRAKPAAKVFDSKTDATESGHKWQFFDAAKGGWNDYDAKASDVVDAAYVEWQKNPYTDVRSISSGQWQYQVDFTNMKQINIQHEAHTQRDVRRVKK